MKKLFASLTALCLCLSLAVLPASALELEDAKKLLQEHYVDQIPEDVLARGTLEEILAALGDPYTVYFTAEEYQSFLTGVNGDTVTGIGVSVERTYNDGYRIMSILPNSPAEEAGLEAGDRFIAVDGETLTAGIDIRAAIGGEEGTSVTVTVIRQADGARRDYTLVRQSVAIPIVTYTIVGDAGVIDCISFGDSTVSTIEEALKAQDKDVSVWIMDLRSNPGGTTDAAVGSAGLFVGSAIMVYFRDADDTYNYYFTTENCPDLTDKPLIILTSPHSASGSELFAAAARDHGFGIALGQRTFGKGIAQIVLDESNLPGLFDGDALKITAYRFYSPDGTTNHTVGILPTLLLSPENTAAAALLLSAPEPKRASNYFKLEIAGQTLYLNGRDAANEENKAAFTELLEALPPSAVLSRGSGAKTWTPVKPASLAQELELDFTPRTFSDVRGVQFQREIETLAAYRLLTGYDDGSFRPDSPITRAEFCAMVANAMNLPANAKGLTFSDVPAGAWYADAVSAMATRGFIAGSGDGTFRPDSTITYEEMVTILAAVADWSNMEGHQLAQDEIPVSEWVDYYEFSAWAQTPARTLNQLGALVGGQAPADSGTRQVAAALLCSLMEGINLLWE